MNLPSFPLALRPDHIALWLVNLDKDIPLAKSNFFAPEIIQNIAIIPIQGPLEQFHYSIISAALQAALSDTAVKAIALLINSPGGVVNGMFDLAEEIYSARSQKPIWSILDDGAYSAAYALASSSDFITVPKAGGVGSIGTVTAHIDITQQLENSGIKLTTVSYGDRKTERYPTSPLSKEAKARMQEEVDFLGEMFVALVSRNRNVSPQKIRNTQALTYFAEEGIRLGLADQIASPREAISAMLALLQERE
ncbi:S49 family peptidase [Entomobacter blattae]|uniref:Signal peptide peptidase SppA n=1 Tax=Entomobacter blattae TaxID=2762277 RepID=A0A7H1NUH3_9PROT|nr:S49 family peptidase [Entomobacter blattae]QNT79433.1 Putative signal peptide peptidase SppA [Entomobacter blattae]